MGKHQYEGLIRSIMPFHVQCYCMLTPVVKYNCIMFLLKYTTTHKYTVTTQIFLTFFQKCCCLYTGAVFPTGGIGGRLGRHSEGGAKNCAQHTKKELCFFFFWAVFFAPLSISPTKILT